MCKWELRIVFDHFAQLGFRLRRPMEEEYISDFGSMDNNQYVSLNNINEGWDDIITDLKIILI